MASMMPKLRKFVANSPFKDNVVLLAGASRGIGAQLAYQLADQSACLMLAARSADKLAEVAAICRQRGAQAASISIDLMDEAQCKCLVKKTLETYGRIDTLLYNAGRGYPARFDTLPDLTTIKNEITLNYLGMVYCLHWALPFLKQSQGRIVGVSSLGALVGFPSTAGYNSSKHALRGFLNSLRVELMGSGVTVTNVFLGAIRTERLAETLGQNIEKIPTMQPERCAALIIQAAAKRQRQMVMTAQGKLLTFLYQFMPDLLDRQLAQLEKLYQQS